jgi:hypothetical protein
MGYNEIAAAAVDMDLRSRIAACMAQEGYSRMGIPALVLADRVQWECAGQPGWGEAYASAVAALMDRPGWEPAVITDGMILSAVQGIMGNPTVVPMDTNPAPAAPPAPVEEPSGPAAPQV